MRLEFETKITTNILYDYMLHHTYSSFSGLLGSIVGAVFILFYFSYGNILHLAAGIVLLLYLPCSLYMSSLRQIKMSPVFQKPLHYEMTDEGIRVSQGQESQLQKWEDIQKAVSTGKSIIVYNTKVNAWIFPRKDMGEMTAKVIEMISTHMKPEKVKIRW